MSQVQSIFTATIEAALAVLRQRSISHVFLVACGGSLSIMMPGKYLLDRHCKRLSSDVYNADEFVCRDPARLGPNALVILCSQTGTTRETVRAAQHARAKGALCIGMTLDAASPLAAAVDCVAGYQASYTTGIAIDAANSNYGILYRLLAGVLNHAEGIDITRPLLDSLNNLQRAIDRAQVKYAQEFAAYAARYKSASAIYTLASGPVYGAAYSYSTCVLMEMQWYNSQAIHANEFFHGPFEIVDDEARVIVLIGLDETRPLAERARDFLFKYGNSDNMLVMDARDLDLAGLDPRFAPYLVPLIFFDVLWKFAFHLADLRGRPMLAGRRYMKKLADY